MYVNAKILFINILITTFTLTLFFPITFSENPSKAQLIGSFAITFYIFLFFMTLANLFMLAISFVTEDLIRKWTLGSHLLNEVIVRFFSLSFIPIIFSFAYSNEVGKILLMTLVTVLPYALLKTFFSGRIQKYNTGKIIATAFYYSIVILIALILLTTLMIGFIY